jgi:nucleoid-associated protein YgaU
VNRNVLIGALAIAIGTAAVIFVNRTVDEDTPAQKAPSPAKTETAARQAPQQPARARKTETEEKAATKRAIPEPAKTVMPSFDIVRISPDGEAVIAGRAAPGAEVTVYNGEVELGRSTANRRGEWVLDPTQPLASGNTSLSIVARHSGGAKVRSDKVVVVVVPDRKAKRPKQAAKSAAPKQALAVLVPREGAGPSKVLQGPVSQPGEAPQRLRLQIIDYDSLGNLTLGGTGDPSALLRVYLDNGLLTESVVGADGKWRAQPRKPVAAGRYQLRVDQIVEGKVAQRIELPFSRSVAAEKLPSGSFAIVQPGNSLWRIARRSYGRGMQYTVIYEANRGRIRNPDLIYPGQVLTVPTTGQP